MLVAEKPKTEEQKNDILESTCDNPECECPSRLGDSYCCDRCEDEKFESHGHCPCECGHPECVGPIS